MNYTQALELPALSVPEGAGFVEGHDAADMTMRQLRAATDEAVAKMPAQLGAPY